MQTGMSKHYAFIEFRRLHVAKLVAETMHGYIIFRRRLQCAVMSKEQQHANMWRGTPASRRRGRVERHAANARAHSAAYDTADDTQLESVLKKQTTRHRRADAKRVRALAALGISLDAPPTQPAAPPSAKKASKAGERFVMLPCNQTKIHFCIVSTASNSKPAAATATAKASQTAATTAQKKKARK
jgi:nucleolar protein 15